MNALRRSNGTLKFMSLTCRKPLTAATEFPKITTSVPRIIFNNYSSVVERNEDNVQAHEKGLSKDIDPFGIEEVMEDKSAVIVQGFFRPGSSSENESPSPPPISVHPQEVPETKPPLPSERKPAAKEDPEKASRLSLYDSWLQRRQSVEVSEKSEFGVATGSYREAHFGKIRMDSDNRPSFRRGGRHEEKIVLDNRPERRRNWKSEKEAAADSTNNEPITETIEADHSTRIRASDFLKKMRADAGNQDESAEEFTGNQQYTEKIVIEKMQRPRTKDNLVTHRSKEEALIQDTNVVPKEYLLPNFNAITHEDMWNILKKTVVFQNDFLLAINKPSGIPVHSKARDCRHTIIEFVEKFADMAKCKQVFPLHRIDKETTGVLLFAKDPKVASILKEKFAKRQVDKVYLGVTKLRPRIPEGSIKIPIGQGLIPGTDKHRQVLRPDLREFGIKPTTRGCVEAITNYKVLHSMEQASFVEISPVTGYKHQIRVHFGMGLGCPILGDHKYSHTDKLAPQRLHPHVLHLLKVKQSKVRELPLHLHCQKISFTLPEEFTGSTEPVYIHAKIPYFMRYTLKRLRLIR